MASYMERAEDLKELVDQFLVDHVGFGHGKAAIALGHIVNLAVRCNPRQLQGTVRKNIVAKAMEEYCNVTMSRKLDEISGRAYNLITIVAK